MEFRILGPLEVLEREEPIELGGPKQRALLAALLLEANKVVPSERLIDALWEEEPPETAQKALQIYVSQLRKLLGRERVWTKAPGYLLRVEGLELDRDRFDELRSEGKLGEALALWRGEPLADFAHDAFAQAEIARLAETRLACLEQRLGADLADGRAAELTGELEALVREHPLRERFRELLLFALYRTGRQADALAAYGEARRALVDELGLEPSKPLRDLQQAILRQDPSLFVLRGTRKPSSDPARADFVGRDPELQELIKGVEDAIAGRGRLFLLVGEPGIGKSRLAEEAIKHARARGVDVLVGRCWEASAAPAYWPWVQSLRSYLATAAPERLADELGAGAVELAQILPELRTILPDVAEPTSAETEGARFRLFDATAMFLRNASQARPLLLFLDDMHAADEPSLLLLQFLVRELATTRVVVIGACRDADPVPGRALTTMLAEVAREPVTTRLALRGLSERDVAEYVEVTAAELALPEFVSSLYEETEGNPLFVGEAVRLLAVEGRVSIPQSVRDVIARRLSHLGEECNRVLLLASILGREFSLAALARMCGSDEDQLLDTLDEAMAARVVTDAPGLPGGLRFAHVLFRDTLYEGATTARRVRLHRLAVEALEDLYGEESGPHLAELAHHAIAGSDFEKARLCAQQAGDRALALLAFEEAARLFRTALDALERLRPGDEQMRCELLLSLGEAENRAGNTPAAKDAFLGAAEIARRLDLSKQLARAAAGYAGRIMFARASGDAPLVPLLEEALTALGEQDIELRARLLARLAGALRDELIRERRDRLSREAVELARNSGNDAALAYALDGRAAAIGGPDTTLEWLALGSELCEVAARLGDLERIGYGHIHRFVANLQIGEVASAEADLAASNHLAGQHRQAPHLWQVVGGQAMLAIAAGNFDEGAVLSSRALEIGQRAHPRLAVPVYELQRYMLCEFRGGLEATERPLRTLIGEYPTRPVLRCTLAHLLVQIGQAAEAKLILDDLSSNGFSDVPFDMEWPFAMSHLAETSVAVGDCDSAHCLHGLLAPWFALNVVDMAEGMRGSVSRYVALLAMGLERWDEAEQRFEYALAMNERMGFRPWVARTQQDFARLLLVRGARGDRARATALETAARATENDLGMTSRRISDPLTLTESP
jgi:eukaryotic-like serine/threonine-protein kinase